MISSLKNLGRYAALRRYKSWSDVPTAIILLMGLIAMLEVGYYGYILHKFGPDFIDITNAQPIATWASGSFIACVILLSGVGFQFFVWSVAATGLVVLLQKRVFDV